MKKEYDFSKAVKWTPLSRHKFTRIRVKSKLAPFQPQAVSKAGIKIERLMYENRKIRSQVNKLISIFDG